MKKIFVIAKITGDEKCHYLKEKKYKGIFYAFSVFLTHAKTFQTQEEAEKILLEENFSSPVEIKAIYKTSYTLRSEIQRVTI